MSHFEAESFTGVFPVGVAGTWAAKVIGINTTNASAIARLRYFETRVYMRFSSVINLCEKWTMLPANMYINPG
jgi:hypothetical protein